MGASEARAAAGHSRLSTIDRPHAFPEAKSSSGSTSPSQPMKCFSGSSAVEAIELVAAGLQRAIDEDGPESALLRGAMGLIQG